MFTGIIEGLGKVKNIEREGENIHFTMNCSFGNELKIDQSVAHDGCCLTVVNVKGQDYIVTAIKETLQKSKLKDWVVGSEVNLERCMIMNGRLDGHIVQGHVDTTGICTNIENQNGSWMFTFSYVNNDVTVEKGSVTINGTSLTVVNSQENEFSVCIIPFTYDQTNFHLLKIGDRVNIEFDIIGKYVAKLMAK